MRVLLDESIPRRLKNELAKNRLVDYLPLVPRILESLDTIQSGQVIRVSALDRP